MSEQPNSTLYQKRCSRFGLTHSSSLYEAADHFLLVEGIVRQRCRRFYFDRVQAIVVRPTFRTGLEMILTGVPMAVIVLLLVIFGIQDAYESLGITLVLGFPFIVLFLFLLIRFLIYGASQEVIFQTAVQSAKVPPLGFRRRARRQLQEIRDQLELVQGERLSADALASGMNPQPAVPVPATPPPPPPLSPPDMPTSS